MQKTVEVPQWQVDVPRGASCAGSTGVARGEDDRNSRSSGEFEHCACSPCGIRPKLWRSEKVVHGPRSSTDGHTVVHGWPHGPSTDGHTVVHGWPHRSSTDRPHRSSTDGHTGRPRMATQVVHGWPHRSSPDGHTVVSGWPHGRLRMATRSSPDGHTVVSGWPHGRLPDGHTVVYRMATGSSTDGHRGRLPKARCSPFKPSTNGGSSEAGRRRCTIVHQNGSEGRLLQVVYGWPTGRPRIAPMDETVRETLEVAQLPFIDKVVDTLVGAETDLEHLFRQTCVSHVRRGSLRGCSSVQTAVPAETCGDCSVAVLGKVVHKSVVVSSFSTVQKTVEDPVQSQQVQILQSC